MTPDLTRNSLLAGLPAWAMALLAAAIPDERLPDLLPVLIAGLLSGALLGLIQAAAGGPYPYAITNPGVATGWFANRNHHGLSLTLLVPLAAAWLALRIERDGRPATPSIAGAGLTVVVAIGAILPTGSRAALALVPVAIALAAVGVRRRLALRRRASRLRIGLALLALALIVAVMLPLAATSESVRRWNALRVADDGRVILFEPLIAMARAYLPWGAGFGSFATVFRIDEPFSNLDLAWLNHAHDDVLEIGIEGGVAAWSIAAAGLGWFATRLLRLWRAAHRPVLGWLGASWLLLMLLASAVDYPLRTPIGMSLFVLAATLLQRSPSRIIQFGAEV